ncbi:MAG: DUF2846 domain-containing protein [Desulfobulbaceae bacterium]|nr:DUF2846 domain-containing protein [Desulfobulbaceae bacterium]
MKKLFATIILAFGLFGCASVPMGDAKQDEALKTFTIAPDKAGVYIYRNESLGSAVKMDVKLDRQLIGQTAAKTFLYKEVTPGKHTISSEAENTDEIVIGPKPGTLTYIWQEVKMGFLSARTKLHLMSESEGKQGVLETKFAVTK